MQNNHHDWSALALFNSQDSTVSSLDIAQWWWWKFYYKSVKQSWYCWYCVSWCNIIVLTSESEQVWSELLFYCWVLDSPLSSCPVVNLDQRLADLNNKETPSHTTSWRNLASKTIKKNYVFVYKNRQINCILRSLYIYM